MTPPAAERTSMPAAWATSGEMLTCACSSWWPSWSSWDSSCAGTLMDESDAAAANRRENNLLLIMSITGCIQGRIPALGQGLGGELLDKRLVEQRLGGRIDPGATGLQQFALCRYQFQVAVAAALPGQPGLLQGLVQRWYDVGLEHIHGPARLLVRLPGAEHAGTKTRQRRLRLGGHHLARRLSRLQVAPVARAGEKRHRQAELQRGIAQPAVVARADMPADIGARATLHQRQLGIAQAGFAGETLDGRGGFDPAVELFEVGHRRASKQVAGEPVEIGPDLAPERRQLCQAAGMLGPDCRNLEPSPSQRGIGAQSLGGRCGAARHALDHTLAIRFG